jgi:hypothetical protein
VLAQIAQGCRAQQRVAQGMEHHVGVGMTVEAFVMVD